MANSPVRARGGVLRVSSWCRSALLLLAGSAAWLPTQALALVPTVPNGIPNVTQVPGKLLWRSPTVQNRVTNIVYHNGWFYTNVVTGADRKAWRFGDLGSAASFLQETGVGDIPLINDHGNHAHAASGDHVGGAYTFAIKRQSPGVNIFSEMPDYQTLTPWQMGGHRLYWPWILPFHWIQYDSQNSPTPTALIRPNTAGNGPQTLYEWNSLAEDGVTGNSILIGNLLFITSDQSKLGVLCYDISPVFRIPAERPVLLDKLTGDFGSYLAVPFQNYIILADNNTNKVEVIDYSDPTDLKHVASINVAGTPSKVGDSSVPYTQAQDNYVFTMRHKIDMNTFTPVLELDQAGDSRPAGSVAGSVDTSQYMKPIGNLLVTAGYSFAESDRLAVWAHQAEPDTRKPYVAYHIPRPGQTNYPVGAPITLLIHEALESYTIINGETITLREVGTTMPLDAWTSFSHEGVLTLTPKSYLLPNKTYELIVADGGIRDALNNGIEPYSFTFSTGATVAGGNASPVITTFGGTPSPLAVGATVTFSAAATDAEGDPLEYRLTYGDTSAPSAWGPGTSFTKTYAAAGHYEAKLQVRDTKPGGAKSTVSKTLTITVADPIAGPLPTHSSTIALHAATRRVWAVNSDADTVSVLDADTLAKLAEHDLVALLGLSASTSVDPRNLAFDAAGNAWITCHDADRVVVLSPAGLLLGQIATGYGSAPLGVATTPNGTQAFVTLTGSGVLKRYATATRAETGSLALGPTPRALAITGDGARVLVTRFLSGADRGVVWDVASAGGLTLTRTISLYRDRTPDSQGNGRGIPTQLAGITLSPDQRWVWVTGSKFNDQHGLFFTGPASTDNGPRALVVRFPLANNGEDGDMSARLDVDNSESPTAVVFSARGDWAFTALQGNNRIAVYDDLFLRAGGTRATKWRFDTDLAPQGLVVDPATNRLFVNNFMARNITVHDLSPFIARGERTPSRTVVPTVAQEKLGATILAGKRIFYNASLQDVLGFDAMGRDTYVSCATCHVDGSQDGRVWDFTQRGEGLRNTIDLRGRSGMGHGNVHWSANFDEIQDFENDIRDHFGGTGLLDGVNASTPLGSPKTGLSPQLDQLAAYVSSLGKATYPKSPLRGADGSPTSAALAGRAVFEAQNCLSCHSGPHLTDSTGGIGVIPTLHDVGTRRSSSGGRLGALLTGIDTPTLIGLHATAPYLHDGSARTLPEVFTVAGGTVYQAESGTVSGGANKPGYININYYNVVHKGGLVAFDGPGSLTLTGIDGGPGGTGALEFLITAGGNHTLTVTVNGTPYTLPVVGQNVGWQFTHYVPVRLENVALAAGPANTVVVSAPGGGLGIDDLTVSTAQDLARAQPHRRVRTLSGSEKNDLYAYLLQLDGSSVSASDPAIPAGNLVVFRNVHGLPINGAQDAAAPAGDGVPNLLKYAFNLVGNAPGQVSAVHLPNARILAPGGTLGLPRHDLGPDNRLRLEFVRRTAASGPGIAYTVQFSDTLAEGSWAANPAATAAITPIDGNWERVSVTDSLVLSGRRFARVLITPDANQSLPVITSALTASGTAGSAFSYTLTATGGATAFSAGALPSGLVMDAATGVLSGIPGVHGVFNLTLGATNTVGTTSATFVLTLAPNPNPVNLGTGLRGRYYPNMDLVGPPALTRIDPSVDFAWSGSPGAGIAADGFSVRWEGEVEAPVGGAYIFSTESDDGVRLWVNDIPLIDNWTNHGSTVDTGASIVLAGGTRYRLRLEFFENGGGAVARLRWSHPGQSTITVPATRLYPATP